MLPLHTSVSPLEVGATETPRNIFHSKGIPLDLRVSDEIRAKIVANKYIDLDTALPKPSVSNYVPEAGTFQLVDRRGNQSRSHFQGSSHQINRSMVYIIQRIYRGLLQGASGFHASPRAVRRDRP
jgi:hypothetical protein